MSYFMMKAEGDLFGFSASNNTFLVFRATDVPPDHGCFAAVCPEWEKAKLCQIGENGRTGELHPLCCDGTTYPDNARACGTLVEIRKVVDAAQLLLYEEPQRDETGSRTAEEAAS